MGEYFLDNPMISIEMGGSHVVLGVEWLQSLGIMALNFQDIFMRFSSDGKEIFLSSILGKPSKGKFPNSKTKLLKNRHHGLITQFFSLDVQTSI
jgi:hypothetical protein